MNIAIALNEKYSRYGYVLLVSIFENNSTEHVTIYLLNRDFSDGSLRAYAELAESYGQAIVPIRIEEDMIPDYLPYTEKWSIEIYFRIILPFMVDDSVDRVLYLDTDVVVDGSLSELYNTPFDGNLFCAVIDNSSGNLSEIQMEIFGDIIKKYPGFSYCNSGVILMNMTEIRRDYTLDDFWDAAYGLQEKLTAPDQDLINYMFYDRIKYLPAEKYNLFARLYFNSGFGYDRIKENKTVIIHYSGPKPWSGESLRTDVEKFWWKYAKLTPYYYEFLEEVVMGEINKNYTNTNEFKYQLYLKQQVEIQMDEFKKREKEYLSVIDESRALIERLYKETHESEECLK